ncbi:MAG: hypothetical protein WAU75_09370 [Solirubrobacteraceae bacterium]
MSLGPERSDVAAAAGRADPGRPGSAPTEPTRQLSLAGTSDHCVNCGAPLASDQRYCVTCGERRGRPRFALAGPHEESVEEIVTTRSAATPRRPRTSAAFNLIAGVATLLLAMGVGVLIGHNNSSNSTKQAAAPAITINGGGTANGATGATAATGGSASSGSARTGKSKHGGSAKSAKAPAPKVVIQKASAAAAKVTGGSAKTAGATATQGSACTAGTAGCQNGKLTGNYFGQ